MLTSGCPGRHHFLLVGDFRLLTWPWMFVSEVCVKMGQATGLCHDLAVAGLWQEMQGLIFVFRGEGMAREFPGGMAG